MECEWGQRTARRRGVARHPPSRTRSVMAALDVRNRPRAPSVVEHDSDLLEDLGPGRSATRPERHDDRRRALSEERLDVIWQSAAIRSVPRREPDQFVVRRPIGRLLDIVGRCQRQVAVGRQAGVDDVPTGFGRQPEGAAERRETAGGSSTDRRGVTARAATGPRSPDARDPACRPLPERILTACHPVGLRRRP